MEARLLHHRDIDRQEWDAFVQSSPQGALYHLCDFADIIAQDWQVIQIREKGKLAGGMQLVIRKKMGIAYSYQPVFSQFWGPLFANESFKNEYAGFSHKGKVLEELIGAIPSGIKLSGWGCSPHLDYATPFHWAGHQILTRYSYRLNLNGEADSLRSGLRDSLRQDIKKAEAQLRIELGFNPETFSTLVNENIAAGKPVLEPRFIPMMTQLGEWLEKEKLGFCMKVYDEKNEWVAGGMFAQFKGCCHYLFGASRPGGNNLALSFLVWSAILKAKENNREFDFEGSMLKGIENFFRAFGGRPVPYLYISRNALPLILKWIRNFS